MKSMGKIKDQIYESGAHKEEGVKDKGTENIFNTMVTANTQI